MKRKALRKHSLHEKTAAYPLLLMFNTKVICSFQMERIINSTWKGGPKLMKIYAVSK